MTLTITSAENGYVVTYEDDQGEYYFVALDITDVCEVVKNLLEVDAHSTVDMSPIVYSTVPNDKT
jgi:hypothetical protein